MRILVPTDFSENALHAARYAAKLAEAFDAQLELLTVCSPPLKRNHIAETLINEEMKAAEQQADKALQQLRPQIEENRSINFSHKVMVGGAVDQIIKVAREDSVDLIVMGTRGAHGINKFLFGSNTGEVIDSSPCPVLAVPLEALIALPKKIVFATNYHDSDHQALKDLSPYVAKLNAELIVLHVSKEAHKSERDLIEQFSKMVSFETGLPQPYYYVLPHDDIQQGINLSLIHI